MVLPTDMEKKPAHGSTAQSINSKFGFLKTVMALGGRRFRYK
jgi:hypothetical protein